MLVLGLVLVAVGAIVRYAVTAQVKGLNLRSAGAILILVGALAIAAAVVLALTDGDHQG